MTTSEGPLTWADSAEVCMSVTESEELATRLMASLTALGWEVGRTGAPGRWVLRGRRDGGGSVAVVATDPPPGRPIRLHQRQLVGIAGGTAAMMSELAPLLRRIPFTETELAEAARHMPLTSSIAHRYRDWAPEVDFGESLPLAGYALMCTIHHQTDFVLLLRSAIELGADPKLITVIDKEYQYRYADRVDATVWESLGVRVHRYSEMKEAVKDHIRRIQADQDSRSAPSWRPTLVLDDGGYVAPLLHDEFAPFLNLFEGIVEQTTSGIWALRPFEKELRLPIFSVAESDLKRSVEAHGVAAAALGNLRALLPDEKFDGRRALVVGFGRIGAALADLLRRMRMQVVVADASWAELVVAREQGFDVFHEVADAISDRRPDFVFSCAPEKAVGADELARIETSCYLVSLTSRDKAFDKAALGVMAVAEPHGNIGTVYRLTSEQEVSIFLVADGYPVNFHFAESMPNAQSDLVMASLLVGALHLCGARDWAPGNDSRRANDCLNSGTLLQDYFGSRDQEL